MRKVHFFIIIASGLGALFSVYLHQRAWLYKIGLPLDDAYIHLQYARNLLRGEWFVYFPGNKPSPGDTSPLWVILIAGLGLIFKNLMLVSMILGGIFYLLTGMMAYLIGEKFFEDKWFGLVFALVVIFTGRMLWASASGMEVTLFSFLSLLGIWLYLRDKETARLSALSGAIFGLASNARPEGHLLFLFVLLDWIILEKVVKERKFRFSFIPWLSVLAYFLIAIPYPVFSVYATGHLVPNTFLATKLGFSWERSLEYLRLVLSFFYHDHFLLHLALPVGVLAFLGKGIYGSGKERRGFLFWLWPLGYFWTSFFITPIKYHFQRYLIPVLPFFILLSFYGWSWVWEMIFRKYSGKFMVRLRQVWLFLIVVWAGALTLYFWPQITAQCVKNIEEMQVKIGYWVKENTEPDALVAANDIGAIFYISERPVLDLIGLVNPEILKQVKGLRIPSAERDQKTMEYLLKKKPDYLIVFPNWYPELVREKRYFMRVYSALLADNLICAGDEMVVYKCGWKEE